MGYHFFDYKYNIEGFSSDLFSVPHIIFIALSFIGVPLVCFFLRKTNHKKVELFLKVFSICIAVLEVVKITWESYWDISTGRGFNTGGLLPLYTCSLFIYTSLAGAWTKKCDDKNSAKFKIKEYSLAYITTISLLSGGIGLIYCNGLNYYPFWTFGAFYSMFFHLSMFAVGMFLLFTGYKKLDWKDILRAWFPIILLSIIATPINYQYGADYMQIYSASGVPLLSTLADKLAAVQLRYIFTIIMLLVYIPFAAIVVGGYKLVFLIINKIKNKKLTSEIKQ